MNSSFIRLRVNIINFYKGICLLNLNDNENEEAKTSF